MAPERLWHIAQGGVKVCVFSCLKKKQENATAVRTKTDGTDGRLSQLREGKSCQHTTKKTQNTHGISCIWLKSSHLQAWPRNASPATELDASFRNQLLRVKSNQNLHMCVHRCITVDSSHSHRARNSLPRDVWEMKEFLKAVGVDRNGASMIWTPDLQLEQTFWKCRLD